MLGKEHREWALCTFRNGKVGDGLPSVHGHAPAILNFAAAEVDDEFCAVIVEGFKDRLQAFEGEGAGGEEEGCYNDLPREE